MSQTVTQANVSAQNQLAWADRLRNLATVLVIAIHVSGPIAQENTDFYTWYWWSANIWDAVSRASVPLFIMLSGYLLLSKDYPLPDFLKRRFTRVAVPALVWSGVYSLYGYISQKKPDSFGAFLNNLAENSVHYHLWFIYLILGLYLVYPILRPWVKQAKERDFWYFFALWAIGAWGYKILDQFFDIQLGLYFELFTNQAGTFVLGYYLGNKINQEIAAAPDFQAETGVKPWTMSRPKLILLSVMMILAGSFVTAWGSWWATLANGGKFHLYFYDYLTPNVGIAAAGWFIFAQQVFRNPPLLEIEKAFAAASFGIYFAHVLVLDWWSQCGYWAYKFHPAKCIPIILALVTLMSFLMISFIRVLPWGKKIT